MTNQPERVFDEFIEACHDVGRRGLVRCSSGNLSRRLDETRMLATASRSWLENITDQQVSVCNIADGAVLEGPKPTVEIGFHRRILKARSDINVVLHFQTPCATTLACRDSDVTNFFVIPEIPYYIGPIAQVPYMLPGSEELAEAVADAMQSHNMAVMSHHGMVTVAKDYAHAIQNAEFFELACQIIVHGGDRVAPISEEGVQDLLGLGGNRAV